MYYPSNKTLRIGLGSFLTDLAKGAGAASSVAAGFIPESAITGPVGIAVATTITAVTGAIATAAGFLASVDRSEQTKQSLAEAQKYQDANAIINQQIADVDKTTYTTSNAMSLIRNKLKQYGLSGPGQGLGYPARLPNLGSFLWFNQGSDAAAANLNSAKDQYEQLKTELEVKTNVLRALINEFETIKAKFIKSVSSSNAKKVILISSLGLGLIGIGYCFLSTQPKKPIHKTKNEDANANRRSDKGR